MEGKLDYKKEYKDLYMPKTKPMIIKVPKMTYIMVEGTGNPNEEEGEYKKSIEILYGLSFTIKMSKMGNHKLEGYFEYVVPPLEGFWWIEGMHGIDYTRKNEFKWYSIIRQPEFVTPEIFKWACDQFKNKKPEIDLSKTSLKTIEEGLCVQVMHKGSYDNEPKTIQELEEYMKSESLKNAIGDKMENGMIRRHHEIYLSNPRKAAAENLKTVIRIPVKK